MNRLLPLLAALPPLLLASTSGSVAAQELAVAASVSREDSIRLHRSARARQAAFERVRRANLPWAWGGGSGECDERIGRFCLTYTDDDATEWQPPEEKEPVIRSRQRLLQQLAETAATIPGDRWVSGQRVRYLVEAGRYEEALAAASECRGERWWCDALLGFAAHHLGASATADSAFTRMLRRMPDDAREEWTDLTPLLDARTVRRYRRLDPNARREFEERFWALADPLFQTEGNDLRSEHLSRHLLVELQDRSETTENISWGSDLREILLRFGLPSGWERIRRPHQLHLQEASLLTHYPDADLDLLPPRELLEERFVPTAGIWDDDDRRARASYPLPRAGERLRWFTPFSHQIAVFRDADSALIVAAYELPEDSLDDATAVRAALAARVSPLDDPLLVVRGDAGSSSVLALPTPVRPLLLSLEAVVPEARRAARARAGLDLRPLTPGVLAASDLLILRVDADSVAERRAAALRLARGSLRFEPGERMGVYWEMYSPGVPWPEALEVSLRLVAADAGWLRRLAQRAGVVEELQPVRLVWDDATRGDETIARSLVLQIPENTPAGRYTLELTLTATGREPLTVHRTIEVGE